MPIRSPDLLDIQKPRRAPRRGAGCLASGSVVVLLALLYLIWADYLPPSPAPPEPAPLAQDSYLQTRVALRAFRSAEHLEPRTGTPADSRLLTNAYRKPQAQLVRALRQPFRHPANGFTIDPDVFRGAIGAVNVLIGESRVELKEGRPAAALDRCLTAIELGEKLQSGGAEIYAHYGYRHCETGALAAAPTIERMTLPELRAAEERVDRLLRAFPAAADSFEREGFMTLYALRDAVRRPPELENLEWNYQAEHIAVRYLWPKSRSQGIIADYFWRGAVELRKPPWQRRAVALAWDPNARALGLDYAHDLGGKEAEALTAMRLLRVSLALRVFRLEHGSYPTGLSELRITREIVTDPCSGHAFQYRRRSAKSIVYSVGLNGVDDGGNPDCDEMLRPPPRDWRAPRPGFP